MVLAHDEKLGGPALAEQGFSEEELGCIHGPVGLDIGTESPEEIALSILAELVGVRRGKGLLGDSEVS